MRSQVYILRHLCVICIAIAYLPTVRSGHNAGWQSATFRNDQLPVWREIYFTHETGTKLPQDAIVDHRSL